MAWMRILGPLARYLEAAPLDLLPQTVEQVEALVAMGAMVETVQFMRIRGVVQLVVVASRVVLLQLQPIQAH